jgi:hypothetical protein
MNAVGLRLCDKFHLTPSLFFTTMSSKKNKGDENGKELHAEDSDGEGTETDSIGETSMDGQSCL